MSTKTRSRERPSEGAGTLIAASDAVVGGAPADDFGRGIRSSYLPDKNMSLRRRQVVRNEASVNAQTEHRPGVAGRFELNCDLSDHRPLPAEIRYMIHWPRTIMRNFRFGQTLAVPG